MAQSVFDKYGIKEVFDCVFYQIVNGKPAYPVLVADSLKVSTTEITGETVYARGGKGNAKLIAWDVNKEATVTIEDALFSAKSMAVMLGKAGKTSNVLNSDTTPSNMIMKTVQWDLRDYTYDSNTLPIWEGYTDAKGTTHTDSATGAYNIEYYDEDGNKYISVDAFAKKAAGKIGFVNFDVEAINPVLIEVSAAAFPGTYYVVGDTMVRGEDGQDSYFQMIFPRAKMNVENTITLEAEGDPSTFNMKLDLLKGPHGELMQLIKYDLQSSTVETPYGGVLHKLGD